MAMEIRITMIVITTISSTKVKPRTRLMARRARPFIRPATSGLRPFRIGGSIGCLLRCLAVHIEHTLAAPTERFGVVLVAAHTPFGLAGERIYRDAPQEAHFLPVRAGQFHTFHQNVQ